jgi:HEAT repeat protein
MSAGYFLVLGLGIMGPGVQKGAPAGPDPGQLRETLLDRSQSSRQSQAALLLVQNPSLEAERIVRRGLTRADGPDVFVALADAVRVCRDSRFVEELSAALADNSPLVRKSAAESLAALPNADLIPKLRKIAEDIRADTPQRQAAVLALSRNGRKSALIALLDLLRCDSEPVRQSAAAALGELTGQANGLDLEKWRKWWEQHKNENDEHWLENRLGYQAARSSRLEGELDRARSQIVRLHEQLYARLSTAERLTHVQLSSASEDAGVRVLTASWSAELLTALDATGRQTLTDVLLQLSRDGTLDVQRAAVLALGRVANSLARDRLRELSQQAVVPIRAAAVRGLTLQAQESGPDAETVRKQVVPLVQKALEDPALEVVAEAAEDLGVLGVTEATPVLLGLLKHPSVPVRQAAAQTLERVAEPTAFESLFAALGDPSAKVRFSLVGALGRAAGDGRRLSASQREMLISRVETLLLRDADPGVRSRAATVLGECALPSILPTLWRRVQAPEDGRVQEKAWGAMIEVLARTADFQLVQDWDRKLADANQRARRLQLLTELHARWHKRDDARALETAVEEQLVPLQLEQGRWAAAFPLVRDLLAQPGGGPDIDRRLRYLLRVGELALREGNRGEAQRAVQDAEPFVAGRDTLAGEFQRLEKHSRE